MKINSQSNISKNAIFSLLAWILPLGLSIVATPLILHRLGDVKYGAYVLILGFISNSFAFNIGRSITKYVAEYQKTKSLQKINQVVSTVFIITLIISIASIVIMILLAKTFVVNVLQVEPDLQETTIKGFYIVGFIISTTIACQVYSAVLQAFHRFDIYSVIQIISNSISTAGNIIIVYSGREVETLLIWNLATTFLTAFVYLVYFKRFLPNFKFTLRISPEILSKVIKYNVSVIVMQIFGNLLVLFERSWVTKRYGSQGLTYYMIPMTLSMLIHIFISSFILVIFPLASEANAVGDRETILSIYQRSTKIVLILISFICLTLIAGRFLVLKIWLGENFVEISTGILVFHTLSFGIVAAGTIFWQIIEGYGYPHYTAFLSFLWLIISVPLMISFSNYYTVESVAAARFFGTLLFIPALLLAENKIFGRILFDFWKNVLLIIPAAVILTYGIELLVIENFQPGIFTLIFAVLAGGTLFGGILLLCAFFETSELEWFKKLHRRLVVRQE